MYVFFSTCQFEFTRDNCHQQSRTSSTLQLFGFCFCENEELVASNCLSWTWFFWVSFFLHVCRHQNFFLFNYYLLLLIVPLKWEYFIEFFVIFNLYTRHMWQSMDFRWTKTYYVAHSLSDCDSSWLRSDDSWCAVPSIYNISKIAHKSNGVEPSVDHWIFPFICIASLVRRHSFIYFFTRYYYPSFCEVPKNENFVVKSSPTSAPRWIQISSLSCATCVHLRAIYIFPFCIHTNFPPFLKFQPKSPSVRLIACVS